MTNFAAWYSWNTFPESPKFFFTDFIILGLSDWNSWSLFYNYKNAFPQTWLCAITYTPFCYNQIVKMSILTWIERIFQQIQFDRYCENLKRHLKNEFILTDSNAWNYWKSVFFNYQYIFWPNWLKGTLKGVQETERSF